MFKICNFLCAGLSTNLLEWSLKQSEVGGFGVKVSGVEFRASAIRLGLWPRVSDVGWV